MCIEGIGEVAGVSEGSPGEKTGDGDATVYAGVGDGSGQGSRAEDPNG